MESATDFEDTRKLGYYCVYEVLQTINGWSVVDKASKEPFKPLYYVPYAKNDWAHGEDIAEAIRLFLLDGNNNSKLKDYERYKCKI